MTPTMTHDPFEVRLRDSGEGFTTLRDDAPEWLRAAVRDAHQGTLPSDWIYAECTDAYHAFNSGELNSEDPRHAWDEGMHAYVDGRVDVYTKNLYQWAADFCLTPTWSAAEEEASELDSTTTDMVKRLMSVQYCAIQYIAQVMVNACRENES